ncbi:unnamed protein product [Closterium sp. NIES-54]
MVTTTTPRGQRVSICTCTWRGRHLATFTRRPGSSLYKLATEPPQVAASAQVSKSGQIATSCSCRLLSHQTLLWHHRVGHPSLPRLRGMHSRLLVSGLPRSLPPLPPSPAPPCLPCVKGRQRADPHSSSSPLTTAPLQTLHMDVWGPARVRGQGRERYFLLVVDDYTRYTTVFPLCIKGEVFAFLIPWICTVRLQLRERFGQDHPVLRLHSDRGGEFSSDLLREFCRGEGIRQSFTLPDSPQQNGIAERCIGLVMEVARTSVIHAAAPHFLWPFATSPTLHWMGKVGDASVFRVWGSRALVCDTSADKLSARAIPSVFLGFVPDAPGWQFYHPTSRRVLLSQDVTFDESVPFYRLFPYRSNPPAPPPLFLAPGPPPVDPLPAQGPAPSRVSQVDPLPGTALVRVAVVSGAAPGATSGGAVSGGAVSGGAASEGAEPGGGGSEGAGSGGAEPEGVQTGGAETEGAEPGGAESEGAESGVAEPRGAASFGAGGAAVTTGAGDPTEPRAAGARGAGASVAGVGGPSAGGARTVDPGAGGAGGTVRPRPHFVPLLQQEETVEDHEPSVLVQSRARRAVAAAPPPLASAATAPAPAASLVAPPLPSPAAGVILPLLSLATAPAAAVGTPALPSPAGTETALGAVAVTPLLSRVAAATAPAAADVTPPLLSPVVAMAPPLPSLDAATEAAPPAAAAGMPSQTAPSPPSPTRGDTAHGLGNKHPQAPQQPAAEKNEEGTVGQTGSQGVTRGEAADSRLPYPPRE